MNSFCTMLMEKTTDSVLKKGMSSLISYKWDLLISRKKEHWEYMVLIRKNWLNSSHRQHLGLIILLILNIAWRIKKWNVQLTWKRLNQVLKKKHQKSMKIQKWILIWTIIGLRLWLGLQAKSHMAVTACSTMMIF